MTRRWGGLDGHATLDLPTVALLASFCLVWGGAMVAIKVGLSGAPPLSAAGIRFALASLTILLLAVFRGKGLSLGVGFRRPVLLLGLLLVVQHGLFNLGINLSTASRAAVFLYTQPVFVAILAHLFISADRLDRTKLLGIGLSFLGLLVAFAERLQTFDPRVLSGDGLVLLSAFCWAIGTIYQKDLLVFIEPSALVFYQMVVAFPIFFLLSLFFEPGLIVALDAKIVLAFLYQGVIAAGLTFAAFAALLKRHSASLLSSFIFLAPIFGVLLGHLILRDPLTSYLGVGLGLVAVGIFIVNRPKKRGSRLTVHG
ncbi:MAG TPA: DMT family transporter [Candidatus Methylomirabilis sp.]|nr:DMT family transporter [Candidatus Methylomirabilis sp.]